MFEPMFRLDQRVALVTGAARGVGAATVRVLAAQGARVAAADIRFEEVEQIALSVGQNVKPYQLDVSQSEHLGHFVERVLKDLGSLDILVNNAGICPRLSFLASTENDWNRIMDVNAKSQFFLMQAVCPIMKRQGGGRIINVGSTGGRIGSVSNASIYSGSKGAITMFTKSIAREMAGDGILINCVAPGVVDTDLVRNLPPERIQAICEQIPLRRLARPEEIAALIAFLASNECSYCTGATFDINGGWVML
jgi:3-oxoacyl-[acyl-carrier protein] reductase